MKKKLNLLWNLKFNFFSVAERPLTFFAYFLNAKKVGRRRLVIVPATAGGLPLFPHAASVPAPALAPVRSHFACGETGLAGRCPRRGQRARYPIFASLKCGPAYSRGVCRGTFLCSTAGPALAPRRSAPFHPKTIVRFRMSVSPEFSVFFICPPPFFCIGSGAHRYTKIRGGVSPPRI